MSKTESIVIAVFLCIAGPFTSFVIAWWGSVLLGITEKSIPVWALTGLVLGIVVVALGLHRWVRAFYSTPKVLVIPLYLFWSAVALAFFMGLPVGLLMLGCLAGLYIGRKARHICIPAAEFNKDARKAAVFTTAVTGLASSAMGALAIQEAHTMQQLLAFVHLGSLAQTAAGRTMLVVLAVPILMGIQYWLTNKAARRGFRLADNRC